MPAENLISFEDLALFWEKDKKSFFHGVHKKNPLKLNGFKGFFFLSAQSDNHKSLCFNGLHHVLQWGM